MSLITKLSPLSDEQRKEIATDLTFTKEVKNGFAKKGIIMSSSPPKETFAFEVKDDNLYLPFTYAMEKFGITRHALSKYKKTISPSIEFTGELRPIQKEVRKECVSFLNTRGSIILSLPVGFGKCHAKDTDILMYDGSIKKVQDITVGEKLMGDDSTERVVTSLARGNDVMYEIKPTWGESFTVNSEHVLCLTLERRDCLYDNHVYEIPVKEYIALPEQVKKSLLLYRKGVDFKSRKVPLDPYLLGLWLSDVTHVSSQDGETIIRELNVLNDKHIPDIYKINSRKVRLQLLAGLLDSSGSLTDNVFEIEQDNEIMANDIVYLCRSLGFACYKKKYHMTISGNTEEIPTMNKRKKATIIKRVKSVLETKFNVIEKGVDNYYGFTITGNHRYLLGDFTVTHNTATAINIFSKIKLKTLVIVNRLELMSQWEKSINKFCPKAIVAQLKPGVKKKVDKDNVDIFIINAINIPKFDLSEIGFVIIDELHLIITEVLSVGLMGLHPRYLLGLSATPYRTDGLDGMIDCYFGKERITRELKRQHTVYRVFTKIKPDFVMNKMGGIDWNSMLNSQSYNEERNEFIVSIVKHFKDRYFLLLVKRVDQGKMLCDLLLKEGIEYDSMLGKERYIESEKRVLVATSGKASVGFDCPKLNTLLLCCDFGNTTNGDTGGHFVQILGRIMRRQDGPEPTVIDIVDDMSVLKKHWADRSKVYKRHSGVVKDFYKSFPEFDRI